MPNVWAHFIFGQLVFERLGECALIESDEKKIYLTWDAKDLTFCSIIVFSLGSAA